jgi:hypothetical protein
MSTDRKPKLEKLARNKVRIKEIIEPQLESSIINFQHALAELCALSEIKSATSVNPIQCVQGLTGGADEITQMRLDRFLTINQHHTGINYVTGTN